MPPSTRERFPGRLLPLETGLEEAGRGRPVLECRAGAFFEEGLFPEPEAAAFRGEEPEDAREVCLLPEFIP